MACLAIAKADVVAAEYYLGDDPGEGNGVTLSLESGTSLSAAFESVDISLVGLDPGTYDVGVRVKDDEDRWSNAVIKRFTLARGDFELAGGLDRSGDANQGVDWDRTWRIWWRSGRGIFCGK